MAKRMKKKVKKRIGLLLLLFILLFSSLCIWKLVDKNKNKADTPAFNEKEEQDEITKNLDRLNYNKEEIAYLKKEISDKNINYLITNEIDKNVALDIIKETYYIDSYLEKYISYYANNPTLEAKEVITRINTHIDKPFYTNTIETDTTLGKFVILNKYYHADGTYEGENLIKVDKEYNLYGNDFYLSKECYDAFLKMYEDAKNAGYAFKINSAYRSYDSQIRIYQGWVNKDGQSLADTYSARAGYSEHQTGYAFDVRDFPFTNDDYSKTKSFTWVSENAYKYGFIIRFPKGKEYITGYQYEPWHYRYCGIECSTYIHENNITFEEYYEYFIKFNNPRGLA